MEEMINSYRKALEEATKRHQAAVEGLSKAGIATRGDYENTIYREAANMKTYATLLKREIDQQVEKKSPLQASVYCYVFTSTLPQLEQLYSEEEKQALPNDRYHKKEAHWKPFVTERKADRIGEILVGYQKAYPLQIVYWRGEKRQYIQLDDYLEEKMVIGILDWMVLEASRDPGFTKFDSKHTPFIAPICEQTRQAFQARIKTAQAAFNTVSAHREQGLPCEMGLFNSSSLEDFLQDLHRLLKRLTRNIRNQSQNDSPLRDFNMNF